MVCLWPLNCRFKFFNRRSLIGFIILTITTIGSILYDRFFCKYICPMGALYGIISKLSFSKIVRNENKCVDCGLCSKKCPMNIDVNKVKEVNSAECISCQQCVLSCPKEGALETKVFNKKAKPLIIITVVLSLFLGGIFISKATGNFVVLPKKIEKGTTIKSEEIKGYMTLKDLSIGFNMDIKEVYQKLSIPESIPENTKLKDISKSLEGFSVEEAREILKNK